MGYARYATPMGDAGYAVPDTCHQDECTTKIDRGLGYLCGDTPGEPSEVGCGERFCDGHLFMPPDSVQIRGAGLCAACKKQWEEDNPELVAAEEAALLNWRRAYAERAAAKAAAS